MCMTTNSIKKARLGEGYKYEWYSMVPALVMSALDIHNCLNLNLIFQDYILENTNCNSLILAVPQA